MNKVCETGHLVYRPYLRRLESLIICRCYYKDSTFSSVIKRDNVKIIRMVLDLHDAIVDSRKVALFECEIHSKRATFLESTIASCKSKTILIIFTLSRFLLLLA